MFRGAKVNKRNIIGFIVIVIILCPIFLFTIQFPVGLYRGFAYRATRDATSYSLQTAVQADLCNQLILSPDDLLCRSNDFTRQDFFMAINDVLLPDNGPSSTYQEVEDKLGNYKHKCGVVTPSDEKDFFGCTYVFPGEVDFWIAISFYVDGEIRTITHPTGS